jgi:hypothetical protein
MRRSVIALIAVLALVLFAAAPIGAITYGEPDEGEHPYVGWIIFYDGVVEGWFSCSGTLLNGTIFLTAGHCVYDIGKYGSDGGHSGGNDVWASFDEVLDLEDFPARDAFPGDPDALYIARSAWLEADDDFIRGTATPHPDYDNFASFPDTHDVGIVELDEDPEIGAFGVLAELGTLDEMADQGKDHNKVILEPVGYGIQEITPLFTDLDARFKATSRIVNLRNALTDGYNVQTSNNPSPVLGKGGTCFGDSGGPVFLNNENIIVGITSFGMNGNCKGADWAYRADIEDTQDFVAGFLG